MASRKVKDWLERPEAATESAVAVETLPQPPEATEAVTDEPDTQSAELVQACQAASTALEALEDWHRRVDQLQSQLAAARAEQQAALEDHSSESEARVKRIGDAQIREKVIAADIEHERGPRTKLINTLREAATRGKMKGPLYRA
jgi:hypothetical protein